VKLAVSDSQFRDEHVKIIILGLTNLRSLSLQGNFAPQLFGGFLTDKTCDFVANRCPDLQTLDLSYQRKVTTGGLADVLSACRNLRELQTSATIEAPDLVHLIQTSPTLLIFGFDSNHFSEEIFRRAIESTGGRTVLYQFFGGLVEVAGLTPRCQQKYAQSKHLVMKASDRCNEPGVYNEWE
jgi:hypothetical protein